MKAEVIVICYKDLLAIFHHLSCMKNTFIAYLKMMSGSSTLYIRKPVIEH
jgi:hypothetical protein